MNPRQAAHARHLRRFFIFCALLLASFLLFYLARLIAEVSDWQLLTIGAGHLGMFFVLCLGAKRREQEIDDHFYMMEFNAGLARIEKLVDRLNNTPRDTDEPQA